MALIKCPECTREVSDKAAACPHCGNPMDVAPLPPAAMNVATAPGQAVTTQATGKGWKAVQLVGMVIMVAGVVSCSAAKPGFGIAQGLVVFFLGMVVWFVGRIGAWWKHG